MADRYFVMLNHPAGFPTPIVGDAEAYEDAHVVLWPSYDDAAERMKTHAAAQAWGYEIYTWIH